MRISRLSVAAFGAASALVLLAVPASAHVTVNSPGATQGGFAKLTFRVPTEENVPTVKLEVVFPANAPLAFASIKPHPGWTYKVVKVKAPKGLSRDDGPLDQVVSRITWTATNGGIKPGEFDEFEVSAGPLPEADQMVFNALQTYQGGNVVRWIETGSGELEHPAPVLTLLPAAEAGATPSPTASTGATAEASASPSVTATAEDTEDDGDTIGVVGIIVGAAGVLLALAALARTRRRTA